MNHTVTVRIRDNWTAIGRAVIDLNTVMVDGEPLPDALEINPTAAMIRWKNEIGDPGPYEISYEYTPRAITQQKLNREEVRARFLASQLANKTPQQIYTAMQDAMDGWGSLADAKSDLREWLPLMAAILAWKVV